MKSLRTSALAFVFTFFSFLWATSAYTNEDFLQCLTLHAGNSSTSSISQVIYTLTNSSYSSVVEFSIQNPRFSTSATPKPLVIVTPSHVSHIQAAINCSQKNGLQIRVRSGGHDYEGLSYVSDVPFLIIDMINLRSIRVNVEDGTAWVESDAIISEVYYRIAKKSINFGFPAGLCPTMGVGGHFSGGGYGTLLRKYGLAADNIIDAQRLTSRVEYLTENPWGMICFRPLIRGGGGFSFGIIVAWKIKPIYVPSTVTVFTVNRSLEQNATKLVYRWEHVANKVHEDLFIHVVLTGANSVGEINIVERIKTEIKEHTDVFSDTKNLTWFKNYLYP